MKKPKLLYVDDEIMNLHLFRDLFRNDFDVLVAKSGEEALEEILETEEIQYVISDMRMPGMDGLELITKAKSERPDVVYCLLTGYDLTKEMEEAIAKKQVSRYFAKPLDPAEIRTFFSAGS
ncbi:response regulator receiver domain protein [Leptospira yanagawae serovar Saopaulo str. Sao Paulo = ATCC 700523]|uniref:Response regulator receiver domain protein n=1 Tax=Leptospira yanagawae serovar Saopaulo str. Sao Paulo = ATCC 700523 TaxID=1249483 RepID=A0A5E8H901_9LEPT|nr:response regulator [Leptospira yanagawae]EOQ87941.1 response regulator receiver domain protein [Leptospira yanagawae serovar Saopaulo str. Sao Paulo = ATCC 700523]